MFTLIGFVKTIGFVYTERIRLSVHLNAVFLAKVGVDRSVVVKSAIVIIFFSFGEHKVKR
jgi:hypothetical protein